MVDGPWKLCLQALGSYNSQPDVVFERPLAVIMESLERLYLGALVGYSWEHCEIIATSLGRLYMKTLTGLYLGALRGCSWKP